MKENIEVFPPIIYHKIAENSSLVRVLPQRYNGQTHQKNVHFGRGGYLEKSELAAIDDRAKSVGKCDEDQSIYGEVRAQPFTGGGRASCC